MDILLLTVPSQHAAKNDAVELNSKRLKQWLDALPVMDVITTVKNLHSAIEPFNEIQLAGDERLKLLEIYHEAMEDILFSYDEKRIAMLPISVEEKKHLQQDIMWLYLNLANGYKTIVKEGFDNELNPKKNITLLLSIYRSMELVIEALLYAFRAHETPPPLAYLEINQLYLYAESFSILERKIKNIKSRNNPTISSLYKQVVLLVASDPYRLNSDELLEINLFLEKFSDLCEIKNNSSCKPAEGKYFIDLMEDMPPCFCAYVKQTMGLPSQRIIDVWAVVQAFGEKIVENELSGDKENFNKEQKIVELLIEQLMGKKTRKIERKVVKQDCYVAIGLPAINYYLLNKEQIKSAIEPEETAGIMVSNLDFEEQADFPLSHWKLTDQEDSGFLLKTKKSLIDNELVIGDVVGLINGNEKKGFEINIAFIRWVRGSDDNNLKMGVEIIEGKAAPLSYYFKDDSQAYDGLYFPPDERANRTASLLIEQSLLSHSKFFDVTAGDMNFSVEYLSGVLDTPVYSQFTFKAIKKE